jgi:hypothetical protein
MKFNFRLWAVYISAIGMAICYTLFIVRHAGH